ncbi:unnamed protein product [Closterium sp. NIES-54]
MLPTVHHDYGTVTFDSCHYFGTTAEPRGADPGGAVSGGAETGGAEPGGAETGGGEPEGSEPQGAEPEGVEPGGAVSEGVDSGGAEPQGAGGAEPKGAGGAEPQGALFGGSAGASPRLSPRQLRDWLVRRARLRSGATGAGDAGAAGAAGAGATGAGGAGVTARAGVTGVTTATGPGGARTRAIGARGPGAGCAGVGGAGVGGTGAGGAGAGDTGAGGARVGGTGAGGAGAGGVGAVEPGGTVRSRPYFVPLLQRVLGVPSSTSLTPPLLCPPPDQSQLPLLPTSPLPSPSPYTKHTTRCIPHSRPPPVPGTHAMTLRPSSVPLHIALPAPPETSLPEVLDPESDRARDASPTISRLLAIVVTDPSFESVVAPALVAELLDFAAACRLDYATALIAESASASPQSIKGESSLGTDVLEDSLHEEILLCRPPGFTGSFPAGTQWSLCRPVYGLRQAPREWHDTLRITLAALGFAPSTADSTLFLRTDTSLPPFYVLVYLGLQITRDRARRPITLTHSHMVHQVLERFGFQFSSPQPTPLSTSHSLSAPPLDESAEPSGSYPELVGCLIYLMTCTRPDLAYPPSLLACYVAPGRHRKVHWDAAKRVLRYLCSTSSMVLVLGGRGLVVLIGHADASWVDDSATQRSSQGYTFSLCSGPVSWRSTRSSSVLSSSCEAEIYAWAMAAQELRWLTYLLTELGEQPRSPPVLYVDNKAMIALCQGHRLEHRTKHIALRYFLAREFQQRGQLRLAYVATRANPADMFTKAPPRGDHQRFSTVLGLVPTLPHLLIA